MKHPREIKIIHAESDEPISPEIKAETEELFAEFLFQAWLKEKETIFKK